MSRTRSTVKTKGGINWHYEQEGSGPHVVLIPDGLGDCHMFDKVSSLVAAQGFTVTTFDMPGMSRSEAPATTYQDVTGEKLASYIVPLLDELRIDVATFWGCSSGGATVLALADKYPERVRNGLPHEVPLRVMDGLSFLLEKDDESISQALAEMFPPALVGDLEKWKALGPECHARLWKNYPKFLRGYISVPPAASKSVTVESLKKRPVDWTVGADTPMKIYFDNPVMATEAGIPITLLPGMHYPYVTHPGVLAEHIVSRTQQYL